MAPLNFNVNPDDIARTFSLYVKAVVRILVWSTVGAASLAGTYVAMRILWVTIQTVLRALGA